MLGKDFLSKRILQSNVLSSWVHSPLWVPRTCLSFLVCFGFQDSLVLNAYSLQVHQSWVFFARTDAKAETPVLWPPHAKSQLIGKDSDAGRDCGQEEKGTTEDEMAGWHHWVDGRESEWTPGVGDGQGGLACCGSWGRKESDTTERLNWTELNVASGKNKTSLLVFPKYQER